MQITLRSGIIFLSCISFAILITTSTSFGLSTYEIDIAKGAGYTSNANCVTAKNCFYPNPLYISTGSTVTWKNTDRVGHNISSGKSFDINSGSIFGSGGLVRSGYTYQFTFVDSGTYDYHCAAHPWMTGQIIVGQTSNVPIPKPTPPTHPTPPAPIPTPPVLDSTSKIPQWVKSLFNLYGQGQISYDDLNNALKFLIQSGIIKAS